MVATRQGLCFRPSEDAFKQSHVMVLAKQIGHLLGSASAREARLRPSVLKQDHLPPVGLRRLAQVVQRLLLLRVLDRTLERLPSRPMALCQADNDRVDPWPIEPNFIEIAAYCFDFARCSGYVLRRCGFRSNRPRCIQNSKKTLSGFSL